jgi:hypothetical protein
LLRQVNVPATLVRVVTATMTLDPRRTRKVIVTRVRGRTTTLATTWPSIRRTETLAVGETAFGGTLGTAGAGDAAGVGVAVGVSGNPPPDGGGGGAGTAVTVST